MFWLEIGTISDYFSDDTVVSVDSCGRKRQKSYKMVTQKKQISWSNKTDCIEWNDLRRKNVLELLLQEWATVSFSYEKLCELTVPWRIALRTLASV